MENKSSPKTLVKLSNPRVVNIRACPQCDELMYGMSGGRDAHCANCGFKDPCCSD